MRKVRTFQFFLAARVLYKVSMPVKLMPHQSLLHKHATSGNMRFPFYLIWHMGSGKTFGACAAMSAASHARRGGPPRVLVLCDKSIEGQWESAVKAFFDGNSDAPRVTVRRFQALNDDVRPARYDMCVVDEAHRFRNAFRDDEFKAKEHGTWAGMILQNPRIIYLSGTPLVSDLENDVSAFKQMMQISDENPVTGRVSVYNPRDDAKKARFYAKERAQIVHCPMTWAQTLWYFLNKKNTFTLDVKGDRFSVQAHRPNAYNAALRRISNLPFPDRPNASPKFSRIVSELKGGREAGLKQLVYSSRRDTGARALFDLWVEQSGDPKRSFLIDGSMDADERTRKIERFNRKSKGAPPVLFVTDAAAQGVDLKGVGVVHLVEPSDCLSHEKQVINRAIRFRSHEGGDQVVVNVKLYVSTFPELRTPPDDDFQRVVQENRVVDGSMISPSIVAKELYKQHVVKGADGRTVDEDTILRRNDAASKIASGLEAIARLDTLQVKRDIKNSKGADESSSVGLNKRNTKGKATKLKSLRVAKS